jgi:hypothetical protein
LGSDLVRLGGLAELLKDRGGQWLSRASELCADTNTGVKAMVDSTKDLGQNDARVTDLLSNVVAERVADSVSHKLHPLIEQQHAQLFKNGVRTPVLRRPSDIGLDYEDAFFPSLDAFR